jgi:hypothetical protein
MQGNTMIWTVTDCWFLSISAIRLQNSTLASENSLLVQAPTETAIINNLLESEHELFSSACVFLG